MQDKKGEDKQYTGNRDQQKAVQKIAGTYDSDALRVLHEGQKKVNDQLASDRANTHNDYKAIEKEAQEILRRAHEEGEVHIVERHRKTPLFLYFFQGEVICWIEGKKYRMPSDVPAKTDFSQVTIRASEYLFKSKPTNGSVQQAGAIGTILLSWKRLDNSEWNFRLFTLKEQASGFQLEPLITAAVAPGRIHDGIVLANGTYGIMLEESIETWITSGTSMTLKQTLFASTLVSSMRPRVTVSQEGDNVTFYIINKNSVYSIKQGQKRAEALNILSPGQVGIPIDLTWHSTHKSLLIQDWENKEIGMHLTDVTGDRIWRSFNKESRIPLPAGVFQSDRTYTLSCLLRRNEAIQISDPLTVHLGPLYVWLDEDKATLGFKEGESRRMYESHYKTALPVTFDSGWFQFTMQKEESELRIFVDGVLLAVFELQNIPSLTAKEVRLLVAGYFMCELRVWHIARSAEQLKTYSRGWLPWSEFAGLSGYWHLFVTGREQTGLVFEQVNADGTEVRMYQEPDLSGNGHHFHTQKGTKPASGDLNFHTLVKYRAPSPFPAVIPLYRIDRIRQGIDIDDNSGRIFWQEETPDGRIFMMGGSVLGHVPPAAMFEIESDSGFTVISQTNSLYGKLILAHARRRKVSEEIMKNISKAHSDGHASVQDAHTKFQSAIEDSLAGTTNEAEYSKARETLRMAHDEMARQQENELRRAVDRRNEALRHAKNMTDDAQHVLWQHRARRDSGS